MNDSAAAARFAAVWRRVGCLDDGKAVFDSLWTAWGEHHRQYHTREHLGDCLDQLDRFSQATHGELPLAEIALWFHDAVYVPGAGDNEARSAAWAERALRDGGAPADAAAEVGTVIRLTDHGRPPEDFTGAVVCDVDLSILGRPPATFAEYERRIRLEYKRVPDAMFRLGRARVLRALLARTTIYQTEHFKALYEESARANLAGSLAVLAD